MTMRIKQYFGRHPGLRIVFDPHAVGHTDAPDTWRVFFRQRLRWDGDMFLYLHPQVPLQPAATAAGVAQLPVSWSSTGC
jgi:hypothetical protein